MSKLLAQRAHAKRRAAERFGLNLTKEAQREIVSRIQNGKAKFLEKQSLRISLWLVDWNGTEMRVVYDKNRKSIVTCLPLKA